METRTAFSSFVMGVPAYAISNKLRNIYEIKNYGQKKIVSCCVLENTTPPTEVGCVRRCTLLMQHFGEALLREKLVETYSDDHHTSVVLEYVSSGDGEIDRCPFGIRGHYRLQSARTTYTVTVVSNSPNRCFVQASTTMVVAVNPHGDEGEEASVITAIQYFWQTYINEVLLSLESEVLSQAYPVLSGRLDNEFRRAYEQEEEAYCEWAASSAQTFPRAEVLDHMEKAIVCWARVLQEYRHQKLIAETVKNDVEGARRIAAETAKQLADSAAMVEAMKLLEAKRAEDPPCLYHPPNDAVAQQEVKDRESQNLQQARRRQLYQKCSTTDPNPPIVEASGNPFTKSLQPEEVATVELPIPDRYSPRLLDHLFTSSGSLNEQEASVVFNCLNKKKRNYVSADDVQTILMGMDHQGMYEDIDGTQEALAQLRSRIQECYANRYGPTGLANVNRLRTQTDAAAKLAAAPCAGEPADSHLVTRACPNALEKMVIQHDERKAERKAAAMNQLAEDMVGRFAFRDGGKLYFDEFCLALMHLLKY